MHVRAGIGSPVVHLSHVLFNRCYWCQAGQEEWKCTHRNRMWKACQRSGCSPQKPRGEKEGYCSKGHALDSDLFSFSLRTLKCCLLSVHLLLNLLLLIAGKMILTMLLWAKGYDFHAGMKPVLTVKVLETKTSWMWNFLKKKRVQIMRTHLPRDSVHPCLSLFYHWSHFVQRKISRFPEIKG